MHIFLVNDDGIGSKGIMALYRAAVERGHEVTMCAPRHQQSAASHRFTLADPLFVTPFELDAEGCEGYAITGSPADCVRVGLQHIKGKRKPVDVVISGINDGYNAGIAVHYSGTVGAAMEGAFHYIPSIATSIAYNATQEMFDHLARYTIEMAEKYAKANPPRCSILNINAPRVAPDELKEAVYAPLDAGYFVDAYEHRVSPDGVDYYWLTNDGTIEAAAEGSDRDYLKKGHITLTVMGHFESAAKETWDALGIQ